MAQDDVDLPPLPDVPRNEVTRVVREMLRRKAVRWISVVFQDESADGDRFVVTPFTKDPTV